ncbi:MAG: hypothetical protein PW734_07085 [Verrucomicrobium sp.]|nr:hypothetical protein [Verrucomicrobium sp.]
MNSELDRQASRLIQKHDYSTLGALLKAQPTRRARGEVVGAMVRFYTLYDASVMEMGSSERAAMKSDLKPMILAASPHVDPKVPYYTERDGHNLGRDLTLGDFYREEKGRNLSGLGFRASAALPRERGERPARARV